MKNHLLVFGFFAAGVLAAGCKPEASTSEEAEHLTAAAPTMTHQDSVSRGQYLTTIMGCNDCHTPKKFTKEGRMQLDSTRLLSGHPADEKTPGISDKKMIAPGQWYLASSGLTSWVGPWGQSFTANLTPDPTGIGEWTIDQFKKAFQGGKFHGLDNSRPIMPPMPWEMYAHANAEDVSMIWTYLHSLKPVSNVVPAYIPPGK